MILASSDSKRGELFDSALKSLGFYEPERSLSNEWSLQSYIDKRLSGFKSAFSEEEICRPRRHRELNLTPPQYMWKAMAFLSYIATLCRGDDPIYCAWAWRPVDINRKYGGTQNSAHIQGCAIDLDFSNTAQQVSALNNILHRIWVSPVNFYMGLGVGHLRVHIDFFSDEGLKRKRTRWWKYESASEYLGPYHLAIPDLI